MIGRRSQSVLFFVFLPHVQCQHDALQIPLQPGRRTTLCRDCTQSCSPCKSDFQNRIFEFQCQPIISRRGKRESGANPERSGHCERGDGCKMSLCVSHEKAQPRSMIRESGNLLKYSVHSFRRKRFALLSHKWLRFEYVKRRLLFRKKRQASFLLACK